MIKIKPCFVIPTTNLVSLYFKKKNRENKNIHLQNVDRKVIKQHMKSQ